MSTISKITPMCETAGSVAKSNLTGLRNCPPENPECGQVNFKKQNQDVYVSYEKNRQKKRNIALLSTAGVLAVGAASMIGLGKLHNSSAIAKLKDGFFKNTLETVTRSCDNACKFVKNKAVAGWEWVKGKWPFGKNS